MTGQGGEAMQVIYMEIEGIKIAVELARDAVRLAWQLAKYIFCTARSEVKDAKYKKTTGRTNIKNLLARANGQPLIPCTMDNETYALFRRTASKYGVLYHAFIPLKTGKDGSVQVMFAEKDAAVVQEILALAKEERIRRDVKNGMEEEAVDRKPEENNRTETMEEFARNAGVNAPEEEYEKAMRERFGGNYEEELGVREELKKPFSNRSREEVEKVAGIIDLKERAEELKQKSAVAVRFIHDEKNGKSQIMEETETHVKIGGKGIAGKAGEWSCVWLPKDAVIPPFDQDAEEGGMRTAWLERNDDIVVEDPTGKKQPVSVKAGELFGHPQQKPEPDAAEHSSHKIVSEAAVDFLKPKKGKGRAL